MSLVPGPVGKEVKEHCTEGVVYKGRVKGQAVHLLRDGHLTMTLCIGCGLTCGDPRLVKTEEGYGHTVNGEAYIKSGDASLNDGEAHRLGDDDDLPVIDAHISSALTEGASLNAIDHGEGRAVLLKFGRGGVVLASHHVKVFADVVGPLNGGGNLNGSRSHADVGSGQRRERHRVKAEYTHHRRDDFVHEAMGYKVVCNIPVLTKERVARFRGHVVSQYGKIKISHQASPSTEPIFLRVSTRARWK